MGTRTSIVIPTYELADYLNMCLTSIRLHSDSSLVEVIVVDNGSKKEDIRTVADKHNCIYVRNEYNKGYSGGCNDGVSVASGEYIIICNNDVVLPPMFEENLFKCYSRDPNYGVMGVLSNYVDGPQHVKYGWRQRVFELDRVIGLCFMVSKKKFDEVGGFNEKIPNNWSDDYICKKMIDAGYKNAVAPIFVYHFGSMTFKKCGIDSNIDGVNGLLEYRKAFTNG